MQDAEAAVVIDTIQKFNDGFRQIRGVIEEMTDEQLIELYERAKDLSNVSWLIRCLILGVAHDRARRGDGTIDALAKEFGIGRRMAELDIQVYEVFIKDNPDFEASLPAAFYQLAARTDDPHAAIGVAMEKKAENPKFTVSRFGALLRGEPDREPCPNGFYMLVPMEISKTELMEETGTKEAKRLYGRVEFVHIAGGLYADIA